MPAELFSRRQKLLAGLIIAGIFLAGLATGVGLTTWLRPPRPPGSPPLGELGPDGLPPPFGSFGLDADQLRRARPIVDRHRKAVEAVVKESFPRIHALRLQFDQEMRTILTPAQARLFDEFLARKPPMPGSPGPHWPPGSPPAPGAH